MKTNDNIFLTGQAGTGKSYTINNFIKWASGEGIEVALTASTGVAAINIGGITIHSFLGTRICKNIKEYEELKIKKEYLNEIKDCINAIDVLIVDEISMLSKDYIDLIDHILKKATGSSNPFGGKRVIFTGDFLQLPPISKEKRTFAFESNSWKEGKFKIINLTKIHRQKDKEFSSILSKIRMGDSSDEVFNFFNNLNSNKIDWKDKSLKLFSTNKKVSEYNQTEIDMMDGEIIRYYAKTWGENKFDEDKIIKNVFADEVLELKVNARVISLKNSQDFTYVNGSLGTVLKLNDSSVFVEFDNGVKRIISNEEWKTTDMEGKTSATFEQIPLKLAYALTIHKSQGMSIDELTIDCSEIFEEGQFYVAISRATNKDKLKLVGFEEKHIKANKKAVSFYKNFI